MTTLAATHHQPRAIDWQLLALSLALAWLCAATLRFGLMQWDDALMLCSVTAPPWWCELRSAIGLLLHFRVFGWLALAGGISCWLFHQRGIAWLALHLAVIALMLYTASLGAIAFVLAWLHYTRSS